MSQLHGIRRSDQFIVSRLIFDGGLILPVGKPDSRAHKGQVHQHIDLVERDPVPHLIPETSENRTAIAEIEIDHPAVPPGTVFIHKVQRNIKMTEGHYRLNIIPEQFIDQRLIELKSLLVRLLLLSRRENTGPGERKPITLKTHFRKERNIFLIVSVQINGLSSRINRIHGQFPVIHTSFHHRHPVLPIWDHIHKSHAPAALLPSAFALVSRRSASPHKIFSHSSASRLHDA